MVSLSIPNVITVGLISLLVIAGAKFVFKAAGFGGLSDML